MLEVDRNNIIAKYKNEKKSIFLHLPQIRLSRLKPIAIFTLLFSVIFAYMLSIMIKNISFAEDFLPSVEIFSKYASAATYSLQICTNREILYTYSE